MGEEAGLPPGLGRRRPAGHVLPPGPELGLPHLRLGGPGARGLRLLEGAPGLLRKVLFRLSHRPRPGLLPHLGPLRPRPDGLPGPLRPRRPHRAGGARGPGLRPRPSALALRAPRPHGAPRRGLLGRRGRRRRRDGGRPPRPGPDRERGALPFQALHPGREGHRGARGPRSGGLRRGRRLGRGPRLPPRGLEEEGAGPFLLEAWRDRVLYEFEPGRYAPAWRHSEASAWGSLSGGEREALESLFAAKRAEGERIWEETGRRLLGVLKAESGMLPCAEDLGSVPPCVPRVLEELGILGLRVLRWTRDWGRPGDPFTPLGDYPELSVACPSVHDSSSLREWWETEADRGLVWDLAGRTLGKDLGAAPARLDPAAAAVLLKAMAASASRIVVYPFQDLLALGEAFRPADPKAERVNVPGSANEWNWGWRLPAALEEIAADRGLQAAVAELAAARAMA
ncbi:MAG TPA: 4-alpha-glucanotransferase [Spirochaetia bacterium]|nr:4-alpha-glucanotransferase [Spirochaetia bacterium]